MIPDPIGNPDAEAWVDAFTAMFPKGTYESADMLGWFANAIMTGYDAGYAKAKAEMQDAYGDHVLSYSAHPVREVVAEHRAQG